MYQERKTTETGFVSLYFFRVRDIIKRMFETTVLHHRPRDKGPHDTRLRLIQAAGEVFARNGFRGAQVRDICRRAGANLAAVNYHFRNKAGLYEAVLSHTMQQASRKYPLETAVASHADPRARLAAMVEAFLLRMLESNSPATKLMLRELADPTPALGRVCREHFRPNFEMFKQALRPLVGRAHLDVATQSVIGMCVFYRLSEPALRTMGLTLPATTAQIRQLARHIARFALGGLDALKRT